MQIPAQFNLNSIIVILMGIACVVAGVTLAISPAFRTLGEGLFLTGIGNLLLGVTEGFSDPTPRGRIFFRIGATAYIVGVPLVLYSLYKLRRFFS